MNCRQMVLECLTLGAFVILGVTLSVGLGCVVAEFLVWLIFGDLGDDSQRR